jgi:hypothetical protein
MYSVMAQIDHFHDDEAADEIADDLLFGSMLRFALYATRIS